MVQVVGCFVVSDGQFLLLKRQKEKPQGNTWGIPSGKVETGENLLQAMQRELHEETGITLESEKLEFKKTFHVNHTFEIDYHVFITFLSEKPTVVIDSRSHTESRWVTPEKALKRDDLIQDLDRCIREIFH